MGGVRITGGDFRGRVLRIPKSGDIRPTQDRVREALFNILAPEIAGAAFIDLFAGSGAVGIEALSRGAASATFVERSRQHLESIRANLALLGVAGDVIAADVYRWMASYTGPGFTMGFADPPYALGEEKGYASVLATLAERNVIRPDGLFVAEMTSVQGAVEAPGWDVLRDRVYGKTRIAVWRRLARRPADLI